MIKTKTKLLRIPLTVKKEICSSPRNISADGLGKISYPIYQVVASGSTKFEYLAVLISAQVICGHKNYV